MATIRPLVGESLGSIDVCIHPGDVDLCIDIKLLKSVVGMRRGQDESGRLVGSHEGAEGLDHVGGEDDAQGGPEGGGVGRDDTQDGQELA